MCMYALEYFYVTSQLCGAAALRHHQFFQSLFKYFLCSNKHFESFFFITLKSSEEMNGISVLQIPSIPMNT